MTAGRSPDAMATPRTTPPRPVEPTLPALLVALAAAAAAVLLLTGPARAQTVEQQRQSRRQAYATVVAEAGRLPRLDATDVGDVFQLRTEDKHLACSGSLADPDGTQTGPFRVEVERFKGPARAQVSYTYTGARDARGAAVRQRVFSFVTHEMPSDDLLVTTSVQVRRDSVRVSRTAQTNDGTRVVWVLDQRRPDARDAGGGGAGRMAQLYVNDSGAGRPKTLNLHAADFHTLLRQYPGEADEYLRPLLRDLGQEAVFAPDVLMAWQVFADQWTPDDRAAERVRALLPRMNDPDYRQRERAVAELEAMGRGGAAVLLRMDRKGLSPEQNLLIDRALAPYAQVPPDESRRLRSDRGFLLDCLYSPDRSIRVAALKQLRDGVRLGGGDAAEVALDVDVAAPDRAAAVEALRKALAPAAATRPAAAAGQ